MNETIFSGTEMNHSVWIPAPLVNSITRALEVRGYETRKGGDGGPWRDRPGCTGMVAVKGKLTKPEAATLLFMAPDEATMDLVWDAIYLSFPDASSEPMVLVERPA